MLREFVNFLSQPIISFPLMVALYVLMLVKYKVFGSKRFAKLFLLCFTPVLIWFLADANFLSIVLTPDNVPISLLLILIAFLTWLAFHKAAENDTRMENGDVPIEATPENREKVWTWPNLVYIELLCIILTTAFLIVWAIVFKAPLEEPANPTWAPNPAKAPWYFLGLQEMLVYFDPWMAGVVLPGIIVVGMMAIPYIDVNPKGNGYYTFKERKIAISIFMFGWLALWMYLIIIGTFLRGPNWTFYGPFEFWDFHKVVAEYNVNLSEIIYVKLLGLGLPRNMLMRELFGFVMMGVYYLGIPRFAMKTKLVQKLFDDMGTIRYYILVFLVLTMGLLPLKMILRWILNLKYIIAMPELEFNL